MQRSWIIGLTVAGVAGTGTASYAAMGTASTESVATTATDASVDTTPVLAGDAIRTITYQVGPAGTVTLATDGTTIVVSAVSAGTGWTVVSASAPAAHVEVQYTDGTQLVTFIADLVNGDMAISITTTGVDTIVVTPITSDDVTDTSGPSDSLPATPPSVLDPVSTTPQPPVTTAPSGGYGEDDDEHEADDGDDHEEEHESENHEEEEDD